MVLLFFDRMDCFLRFNALAAHWAVRETWDFLWGHRWHVFRTAPLPIVVMLLYQLAQALNPELDWNDVVIEMIVALAGVAL